MQEAINIEPRWKLKTENFPKKENAILGFSGFMRDSSRISREKRTDIFMPILFYGSYKKGALALGLFDRE